MQTMISDADFAAPQFSLDISTVARLVILRLSEEITTPLAISPDQFERDESVERFETTNPNDFQAAFNALCASEPQLATHQHLDTRWGILFLGQNNERLCTAYVNKFGVLGVINRNIVYFKQRTFLQWLKERFPV